MSDKKITAYYVVSTHWDREWYEPFQHFRYHLVELMDEVLATMQADERFRCFQTDGQSIIVEDYLEIRPERESLVRQYADEARLRIGPWYTMPDENIVAPESLIRNLEEGIRVARDYGNISKAGFICDIFGHVSQIPQIFAGFKIHSAFVFRGVNEDTHRGLFRWIGADGTQVLTTRFGPKDGYFDLAAVVRRGFDQKEPFVLDEGIDKLSEYVDMQRERVGQDTILLFDGGDHMPIEPQTVAMLEGLKKKRPDVEIRFAGLDDYAEAINKFTDSVEREDHGELHHQARLRGDGTWLIPGVLSSRIRMKQGNRAREAELYQWAEPFSLLAEQLAGVEYPYSYIRRSWRYVLENHAHDSICGCSPDQVHKDMDFRFDQARMINGKVIDNALRSVATRVDLPDFEGEDFAMVLFNPSQSPIDEPVDVELWFDEKTKNVFGEFFNYESKVGFRLFGPDDQELVYDRISYQPQRRRFHRPQRKAPMGEECIVVNVTVPLHIPAGGYTTITCKPEPNPIRHPFGDIVRGDRVLENEHLRVEVQSNGSLSLTDKRTKQCYDNLMVFEERADIGDGWYHGVAVNDQIYSSTACASDVAVIAEGAQKGVLRVSNRMHVPECFLFEKQMRRSDKRVEIVIETDVTLRAGADHVELHTRINNQVRDHRVRVMFESNADAKTYWADSAFDVAERNIVLPADHHTYKELAVETTPQANWTAVFDKSRGLAVVAPDLPESTVRDVPERTVALTLLRGFRRTVFTDGEEGGQDLGRHEFRYRLMPLAGQPDVVRLANIAQRTQGKVRAIQVLPRIQPPKVQRTLPRKHGQFEVAGGAVVVSSFRRYPENQRVEVRVHNPTGKPQDATLRFDRDIKAADLVDFEHDVIEKLSPKGSELSLRVDAKKIATIAIDFAK